jgi:hypothetical protein
MKANAYIEQDERSFSMRFPKLSRKWIIPIAESMLIMIIIAMLVVSWIAWIDFQSFYSGVMKNLDSPETKAYMRNQLNGTFTPYELLNWTNQHLKWAEGGFARYTNPEQILNQGKGLCQEFVIVYIAACLASGYEARFVVSTQFYLIPFGDGWHSWAEVKMNGVWIQADPSPTPSWNDTSHYENWHWGSMLTLGIYAFEESGKMEDITARYKYDGTVHPIWLHVPWGST